MLHRNPGLPAVFICALLPFGYLRCLYWKIECFRLQGLYDECAPVLHTLCRMCDEYVLVLPGMCRVRVCALCEVSSLTTRVCIVFRVLASLSIVKTFTVCSDKALVKGHVRRSRCVMLECTAVASTK